MEITKAHRVAISQSKDTTILRDISLEQGMSQLADECKKLVLTGITTIEEMIDIAGAYH